MPAERRIGPCRCCVIALLLAFLQFAPPPSAQAASPAPVAARNGMVVTAHHLATDVGVDILRRGGNAIDAAVAVGYALAVVYPAAGNLGGGGFMTLVLADGRKTFIDFREKAPLAATPAMYLDQKGSVIAGLSTRGHLAVAVPGTVAGLEYARDHFATLPRATLLAPAIRLADQGFVLEQGDADMLDSAAPDLRHDPASRAIFLDPTGAPIKAGDRLVQRDLAATLRAIARAGANGFYKGPVAEAIAKSNQAGGGLLTLADLTAYEARERRPVECNYRGYQVISAPPPSSGGVALCEMLNILEGYPLADLGFHSAAAVHDQIEAMRHAYADRNSYLGDPDVIDNPVTRLTDKAYAATIRDVIDPRLASDSRQIRAGLPPHEGVNTTHFSIADRFGNAVALTYTLNDWFGARVTAAGTGVLLNDEMDDFTAKAGVPNLYGLVQGDANAIAPGKRPLSSMCPTVVARDGKPVMVVGTPGGSQIISAVLLTILNTIDYGMTIQEAVDAPRFHQQWMPDVTRLEPFALSPDTQRLLEADGYRFAGPQQAGHVAAVMIGAPSLGGHPVDGMRFFGANDPRRGTGLALGY